MARHSAARSESDTISVGGLNLRPVKTIAARQVLKHESGETVYVRLTGEFREDHRTTNKRDGSEGEAKTLLIEVQEMRSGHTYDYPVTVQTKKAIEDNYRMGSYVGLYFAIDKMAVGEGKGVRYATSITEVEPE